MTPQLKTLLKNIQQWMLDNDYECGPCGSEIYNEIEKTLDSALDNAETIDQISEFGAENLSVTTHPVVGLQRWADKQYMVSFCPTDIKGERFKYQESGIGKVYDLFLTEEQVEVIVGEYNKRNGIFSE